MTKDPYTLAIAWNFLLELLLKNPTQNLDNNFHSRKILNGANRNH